MFRTKTHAKDNASKRKSSKMSKKAPLVAALALNKRVSYTAATTTSSSVSSFNSLGVVQSDAISTTTTTTTKSLARGWVSEQGTVDLITGRSENIGLDLEEEDNDEIIQVRGGAMNRRPSPPLPPKDLPLRFLRAGKNDPVEGRRRYDMTLEWRRENSIDTVLYEPQPHFELIKRHYPQFFHLRGRNKEPVWYEMASQVDLKSLRQAGLNIDQLMRHYFFVTEFEWQVLEPRDDGKAITVIDVQGMKLADFAGEVVDFVRKTATLTGQHYPERAGKLIIVNVPSWFSIIWNVVKRFLDPDTLKKVSIVRGKKQITKALLECIDLENIPPEYGGTSMPLGQSPEEAHLRKWVQHNACDCRQENCKLCAWSPPRSY